MKLLVISVLSFSLTFSLFAQEIETDAVRKAPDFKLENIDGKYVELSKEIGNGPIIISFWATWCKPCIEELTQYKIILKDYEPRGLKIIAISTDDEKTAAKVRPLVKSKGFPFIILLDPNSDVARKYYVPSVPYTVILDKLGNIIYTHLGYMKGDEIKVREKLAEMFPSKTKEPQAKD